MRRAKKCPGNVKNKGFKMYHSRFKGMHYEIGLKHGGLLKKNNIDLFGLTELA